MRRQPRRTAEDPQKGSRDRITASIPPLAKAFAAKQQQLEEAVKATDSTGDRKAAKAALREAREASSLL